MQCTDCKYCGMKLQPDKTMMKVCRKAPPTMTAFPVPQGGQLTILTTVNWPAVQDDDWCGEYQPRVLLS